MTDDDLIDDRNALHWTDQPKECAGTELISRVYLRGVGAVEIRRGPSCWYLTAGNLFGSQTLRCADATVAWQALDAIYNRPRKREPVRPPKGAELIG